MAKTKTAAVAKAKTAAVAKAVGLRGVVYVLVREGTSVALNIGERVETFRGEKFYLRRVEAPQHQASTGRVFISRSKTGSEERYYPGVIDAEWMPDGVWSRAQQPTVKPVPAGAAKKLAPAQCMLCDDAPPVLRITVTTLDGTVLDGSTVCRTCALGPLAELNLIPGGVKR
jgi:hypothetical protein